MYHFWTTVKTEVPVEYECHECSLMMDVLVKTRGYARGFWPGQALKDRAMETAFKAAETWACFSSSSSSLWAPCCTSCARRRRPSGRSCATSRTDRGNAGERRARTFVTRSGP